MDCIHPWLKKILIVTWYSPGYDPERIKTDVISKSSGTLKNDSGKIPPRRVRHGIRIGGYYLIIRYDYCLPLSICIVWWLPLVETVAVILGTG